MSLLNSNFVVEDGTGLATATSYVSVEEAKAYVSNVARLGLESFSGDTDDQIQSYLNASTLFLDNTFVFDGQKKKETQALEFPRDDETEVPLKVKYACIEIALLIKNNKIYVSPGTTTGKVIERKIGPITTKFAEGEASSNRQTNLLTLVNDLLSDHLAELNDTTFIRG